MNDKIRESLDAMWIELSRISEITEGKVKEHINYMLDELSEVLSEE